MIKNCKEYMYIWLAALQVTKMWQHEHLYDFQLLVIHYQQTV